MIVVAVVSVTAMRGQQVQSPPVERVLHLWVDPVNGSDSILPGNQGAPLLNPRGQLACGTTPFLPNDFLDPTQGGAPLLHAPWPFRTVTAAINYLYNVSPNPPPAPPLPYSSPTGYRAVAAIIHALPGYYGAGTTQCAHNGLFPNGETFPIHLPPHVSVRGTSALNTVFDVYGNGGDGSGSGPAFEFGVAVTPASTRWAGLQIAITGDGCFLDKLSFVGARPALSNTPYEQSAAVVLRLELSAAPTIANCVFFKNRVGLAVVASFGDPPATIHEPTIVNCTFADNRIGLWNGQIDPANPLRSGVGVSPLLLLNDIFDGMPLGCDNLRVPQWPASWGISSSDFEGVSAGDLNVVPPNPAPGNYNAYNFVEGLPHYDYAIQILANYPITVPSGPAAPPTFNIAPFTGWGSTVLPRGVLFVRDLICNGSIGAPTEFPQPLAVGQCDGSPMDFRLSPSVALASGTGVQPPSMLNPLVDAGYGDAAVPLVAAITMGNGRVLTRPPGYIPMALGVDQATWPYSCWDEDCEGYGNPRLHDHPSYANGAAPFPADIGADEVDELVVAGYRAMTTSFLQSAAPAMDNRYLQYLGPAGATAFAAGLPSVRGYQYPTPPGYNNAAYDRLTYSPWAATWAFGPAGLYYVPRRVDVMPHLLPDLHPWWTFSPIPAPANPLWQWCNGPGFYNPFLYLNPSADVINPPGAGLGFTPFFQWLDGFAVTGTPWVAFGPWGGGPVVLVGFSAWCVGTDGASFVDVLPPTGAGVALRFSAEMASVSLFNAPLKNLQTLHVFVGQ